MSRSTPSQRRDYLHFEPLTLRWDDNDIYGHLNNTVHYRLCDTAVNTFLLRNELLNLETSTHINMVVETGCRFFAEARFPDEVVAGLRILHIGTSSVRWQLGFFANANTEAFADLHFANVRVDQGTRRPVPIPERDRLVLERLLVKSP